MLNYDRKINRQGRCRQARAGSVPRCCLKALILINVLVFLLIIIISGVQFHFSAIFLSVSLCSPHIPLQEENETALLDTRALQEHLEASEHLVESLRRELRELGARQGHTHTELQQARLQAAQLALQLSEENLAHREELASWALEREALKHVSEVRKPQHMCLMFFLFVCFYGSALIMSVFVFFPFMQNDKKKIQELSCEVQMKEEWLREERMERERLEVQLGGVQEQNRVSERLREV